MLVLQDSCPGHAVQSDADLQAAASMTEQYLSLSIAEMAQPLCGKRRKAAVTSPGLCQLLSGSSICSYCLWLDSRPRYQGMFRPSEAKLLATFMPRTGILTWRAAH